VYDVLGWLADGITEAEILEDFPELEEKDIRACLGRMTMKPSDNKFEAGFCSAQPTG